MKITTKKFIGGMVIGFVFGAISTFVVLGNYFISVML